MGRQEHEPGNTPTYNQLSFEDFETETHEIALFNCVVATEPIYKKEGKSYEWHCTVSAPPDIFSQEHETSYELHAKQYAKEAHRKRLHSGDVIHITGIPWTQTIALQGGGTTHIHHFTVATITLPARHKAVLPLSGENLKHTWVDNG